MRRLPDAQAEVIALAYAARLRRTETVQTIRDDLHEAMAPNARQRVEELTGPTVLAILADHHSDPDAGVLVFLLEARTR